VLQPPICGIDDSSHQPQRRAAAASPGHRSAKCSAWPPDSARTRGRCDGAGPKPRTPGPRPDRNWPKWLVKPWFRHVETMVETMVNHRFTSQSGDLSIKMNGIEGMWRFQYGDFWVSLFKIPKSPLVSVLNWFNFGWFGGRPILGNLHMAVKNIHDRSAESWMYPTRPPPTRPVRQGWLHQALGSAVVSWISMDISMEYDNN